MLDAGEQVRRALLLESWRVPDPSRTAPCWLRVLPLIVRYVVLQFLAGGGRDRVFDWLGKVFD
jgi:hypothetical protein